MKVFKIDNACAGQNLKVEKNGDNWFYITSDYGLVSFTVGTEVMFASGRVGSVVFDTIESVDIESQIVTLAEFGPVEIKRWEYFARV